MKKFTAATVAVAMALTCAQASAAEPAPAASSAPALSSVYEGDPAAAIFAAVATAIAFAYFSLSRAFPNIFPAPAKSGTNPADR